MLGFNFICRTPWRSITLQRAREMLLLWAGTMSWRRWLRSWSPGGTSFSYSLIVGLTPLMLQSLMTTSPFRKVPMPLSSDDITLLFSTWRELNFLILQQTHWQSCHQMSCCGVEGYKDFEKARPFMDQVETVSQIKLNSNSLILRWQGREQEWWFPSPAVSWNKTPTSFSLNQRYIQKKLGAPAQYLTTLSYRIPLVWEVQGSQTLSYIRLVLSLLIIIKFMECRHPECFFQEANK